MGATVTVCLYLLPPLLRRYRERYPRQEIVILNERSRQIPELVRERRIDVGIASSTYTTTRCAPDRLAGTAAGPARFDR